MRRAIVSRPTFVRQRTHQMIVPLFPLTVSGKSVYKISIGCCFEKIRSYHRNASRQSSQSRRSVEDDDNAFKALHKRRWYEMGAGAWVGLALVGGVGIALIFFFWQHRQERERAHAIKMAGRSRIGGNWTLVDETGAVISAATFHGQYVLLYFGFTFCPDVCPIELKKMATIVRALDSELPSSSSKHGDTSPSSSFLVQPLFVSLDPWRDSVEQIAAYTKQFLPGRLLGATGTPQQCDTMAKMFRVYTSSDRASEVVVDASVDDYTVDHSIFIYLLDPAGKFVDFYGVNKEAQEVVDSIREHMIARGDVSDTLWRRVRRIWSD